jgi:hypothetical protein
LANCSDVCPKFFSLCEKPRVSFQDTVPQRQLM